MIEAAIGAHCQYFYIQVLELIVTGGDRRQFRRSDKGEISWIEAEHNPSALMVREPDRFKSLAFYKSICLKIRSLFTHSCQHFAYLLLR